MKIVMPEQSPLWISEADVVSLMSLRDAIDVLERGLLAEARGVAQNHYVRCAFNRCIES